MTTALNTDTDRRVYPRTLIDTEIKFKLCDEDTLYSSGRLIDLSQTGVLLEIEQALYVGTHLSLLVGTEEAPIEFIVDIARIADTTNDNQYTYGCYILDIINS